LVNSTFKISTTGSVNLNTMHTIATTSPFSVRSFRSTSQQPSPPADPDEQKELDRWVKRYQPELGLLQSPPAGPAGPKARPAQKYINDLVTELAGERLKSENIDLRVEVFSGDIAQAGLDDSTGLERNWAEKHPDKPWPIRTWLEAPKQGEKPLYRLAVSQGLLETLKTREELGFVVAHQLQELFEHNSADPNNENELEISRKSFLDSREAQLANDAKALQMMVAAGLNPQGALGALEKLYRKFAPKYPADDQKAALTAAAQIQEHEGIRTSAMQFQVEDLRRRGDASTAKPVQELPAEVVAKATGDYQGRLENFPAFQAAMSNAAQKLATEETPDWMFGDRSQAPELELLKAVNPSPGEYESALLGVCEHLSATVPDPQHRVSGFLRLAIALDGECFPAGFSAEGQQKIRDFLTSGTWSGDRFLSSLEKNGKSLHRELVRNVQLTETFQAIAAPLHTAGGEGISRLVDLAAASFCRNPETAAFELEALPMFLTRNNDDEHENNALVETHNQASLALLRSQDPQKLAQENHAVGLPRGLVLGNDMREVRDLEPGFRLSLRETMEPIESASFALREDNARLRLRPPLAEPSKLGAYLQELFASEAGGDFSGTFESDLPALLLDTVRTCNHQPDLLFDSGRPRPLEKGLERRLHEMLGKATPENKDELARFLSRTWSHELRVPTHSERRAWTAELSSHLAGLQHADLVRQLSSEDISQHAAFFKKTLLEGYLLTEDALPDTSTPNLAALEKRVAAGEFEPKEDQYSDPAEYEKALAAYQARQEKMQEIADFLAPAEARLVLSKLAVLGHHPETSLAVSKNLSAPEFLGILKTTEDVVERSKIVRKVTGGNGFEVVGTDAGTFLLDGFLAVEKAFETIDEFYDLAKRTAEISPGALESRSDTRTRMAIALYTRLDTLEPDKLREWMGKERVLDTLKPEQTSKLLIKLLGDLAKPGSDTSALGSAVKDLDASYKLKEKHGLAYVMMRDSVTEKTKLQPKNLNEVFPPDETGPVDYLAQFKAQLSGLSGLIAMTRNHPPKEQLATIEYLMGRSEEMPKFLEDASENQSLGPVAQTIRNARQSLAESEVPVRVMVANSFLAGPNGLLQQPGGKDAVLEHFLANVQDKSLKLARPITQAILVSQGDADSLAVAVVLGQRPKKRGDSSKLTEADILSRVFDSYGVPGVKMKQYLAFTSQFEQYREAFESAQDAANPLNYFEVIRLIQTRFGDEWPADLEVDRVLGSGSVNIAIRYTNKSTGKREVVSLGREAIEEQTNYDFARFNKFVDALVSSDEGRANFGFIKGLTGIIEDSVELEFDKENARSVQRQAYETYKHTFKDGWTVRSIDAFQAKNLGLFMEEAKGTTARKTLTNKPELYRQAMRHMATAEFNLLKGRDSSNNLIPRPNFANPDIHDGQVLIDEANKTVTVLDFGQAVPIDNKQRELALDMLVVLGKLQFAGGAAKRLNKRFFPNAKKGEGISKSDIKDLWKTSPKKMDQFIRLLSLISSKGGKVPLSVVHWVLALNRQYVLGEKLDQGIKAQVVGLVVNKRLGLPLSVYNTVQAAGQKAVEIGSAIVGGIAGFVTGWFCDKTSEAAAEGELKTLSTGKIANLATLVDQATAPKEPEKAWRKKDSWGFYLDDFGTDES
jgi:hypothetical protein